MPLSNWHDCRFASTWIHWKRKQEYMFDLKKSKSQTFLKIKKLDNQIHVKKRWPVLSFLLHECFTSEIARLNEMARTECKNLSGSFILPCGPGRCTHPVTMLLSHQIRLSLGWTWHKWPFTRLSFHLHWASGADRGLLRGVMDAGAFGADRSLTLSLRHTWMSLTHLPSLMSYSNIPLPLPPQGRHPPQLWIIEIKG